MTRLLIVEDQSILLDSIRRGLAAEGFEVFAARTAEEGQSLCESENPEIILLDLMLPDGDGLQLLATLRQNGFHMPVLVVSSKDAVDERVNGLNAGADDYLTKPFVFSELLARVRALLRRKFTSGESILTINDIIVDLMARTVTQNGRSVELTPRQFEVLAYLLKHKNEIVTREMLARDIWRSETATWTNLIEVQINRLRNKLEGPGKKLLLHTIRGEGYVLGDRPC